MECLDIITQNTDAVLSLGQSCSTHQLTLSLNGGWNVLQILEHIYIVDRGCKILVSRPSQELSEQDTVYGKEKLAAFLVKFRQRKVVAPESMEPKGKFTTFDDFKTAFSSLRQELVQDVEQQKIIVDNRTYKHPVLGAMTVTDWLYFIPFHAQRHVEQIQDILGKQE